MSTIISSSQAVENLLHLWWKKHQLIVVSWGFFGDEAKGKIVDALLGSPLVSWVARLNSWENAWHTVVHAGKKYVFHIMPSGIISGKMSLIGNEVVMDPLTFLEWEILPLLEDGVWLEHLNIGNCDIVLPWHKLADLAGSPNSSTGKWMSQVHGAKSARKQFKLDDVLNNNWSVLDQSYELALSSLIGIWRKYPTEQDLIQTICALPNYQKLPLHIREFLTFPDKVSRIEYTKSIFREAVEKLNPYRANIHDILRNSLERGEVWVFEWPQSYYLSNSNEIHPDSATSARTDALGILQTAGIALTEYPYLVYNVVKIPSSRVGSGANPSGLVDQDWFSRNRLTRDILSNTPISFPRAHKMFVELIDKNTWIITQDKRLTLYRDENQREVTVTWLETPLTVHQALAIATCQAFGEFWSTTGKPRVTWPLDLPHMRHIARAQGWVFSLSRMDAMDDVWDIPLVVGYIYRWENPIISHGQIIESWQRFTLDDALPTEDILMHCDPVYQIVAGWQDSKNISMNSNLPKDIEQFLKTLEELTWARILSYGNGPDTDALVHLSR